MPTGANISQDELRRKTRWKMTLDGISNVTKLITAPLFALGGTNLIVAFTAATANPILLWVGAGLLIAAATSLATAIIASHAANDIEKSLSEVKTFAEADLGAQRTAHHLVQALKANNLCLTSEESVRKNWESSIANEEKTPPHRCH